MEEISYLTNAENQKPVLYSYNLPAQLTTAPIVTGYTTITKHCSVKELLAEN